MKKGKFLLAFFMTFALAACDKDTLVEINDFVDEKIKSIKNLTEDEKETIKSSVSNYLVNGYIYVEGYDGLACNKAKLTEKMEKLEPYEIDYFSYDDQLLKLKTEDGYNATVQKQNNLYVKDGNYFTLIEKTFGNPSEEAKRLYELCDDDKIFSFGIDSLILFYQSKTNLSIGDKIKLITSSAINSDWYKNLYVAEDDEQGNFTIALSWPVKVTMDLVLTIQGSSIKANGEFTFDFFEIEYCNNLLKKSIYSATAVVSYEGYSTYERAYYQNLFEYNVDPSLIFD